MRKNQKKFKFGKIGKGKQKTVRKWNSTGSDLNPFEKARCGSRTPS
jgi:hypothetical protein